MDLPRDVELQIIRKLDIDSRRALGIYTKLSVPDHIKTKLMQVMPPHLDQNGFLILGANMRRSKHGYSRPIYRIGVRVDKWCDNSFNMLVGRPYKYVNLEFITNIYHCASDGMETGIGLNRYKRPLTIKEDLFYNHYR